MKMSKANKMFQGLGLTGLLGISACCILPLAGLTLGAGFAATWIPRIEWLGVILLSGSLVFLCISFFKNKKQCSPEANNCGCGNEQGASITDLEPTFSNREIACDMSVFTQDERKSHYSDSEFILKQAEEVIELENGYAFRHPYTPENFIKIAEWVTRENKCCPFMTFNITLQPLENENKLWLKFGGSESIKEYLKVNKEQLGW